MMVVRRRFLTAFSLVLLLLTILFGSLIATHATSGYVSVPLSFDVTKTIGEFSLPSEVGGYGIRLRTRLVGSSTHPISYHTDRDFISPGDSLSLSLNTSTTTLDLECYLTMYVLKGSETILVKEAEVPLPLLNVPSTFETPQIPAITVPLHELGVPVTIALYIGIGISSDVSLHLQAERLQPPTQKIIFEANKLEERSVFNKPSGVGARFAVDLINLELVGYLSTAVDILEIPVFRYNLPDLNLGELSAYSNVAVELTRIKTPIDVTMTLPRQSLELGEVLKVEGRTSPSTSGLQVNLLVREAGGTWSTIASTTTNPNGSFSFEWRPSNLGEYEIMTYCVAGEYTTESSSTIARISVARPPSIIRPIPYLPFAVVTILVIAVAFVVLVVVIVLVKKIVGRTQKGISLHCNPDRV